MEKIALTALRRLSANPLVYCLFHIKEEGREEFLGELYSRGGELDLLGYLSDLILKDENAFSLTLAKGKTPSKYVIKAFFDDAGKIFDMARSAQGPDFEIGKIKYGLDGGEKNFETLKNFYLKHGCGDLIGNVAFDYDGERLVPIENVSKTTLKDLKEYESEKREVIFNTENFISGSPFYNMLLYGDRGTGKSSTVQALINEYSGKGLRLIQLDKKYIGRLNDVRRLVGGTKLKFLLFIDDLTLSPDDRNLPAFKAALEGSVYDWDNCMVVATSNRRHIIKESFTDRDADIHPGDANQDIISLSDRFGLTVLFSTTGKEGYLSIVRQLSKDMELKTKDLDALAEKWAMYHGGRSPRCAKQFCLYVSACEKSKKEIDF
ncbi:MAG: ATP-binding protein [Clostridia bacterium]|nr:ATP-binding protein [Clostridia bacterium]